MGVDSSRGWVWRYIDGSERELGTFLAHCAIVDERCCRERVRVVECVCVIECRGGRRG